MTSCLDVESALLVSVLVMDAASQAEPGDIGTRVTELAAKLICCKAVDIVRFSADGALLIPASSDRALSALSKVVWQRSAATADPPTAGGRMSRRGRDYHEQMRSYCKIEDERLFPLVVAGVDHGSLRFLFGEPAFSSSNDAVLAAAFAMHAAIAVDRASLLIKVGQLQTAMTSNREIGAAVGILMARRAIDYRQGFVLLLNASQNDNRKLRDVAADVLCAGELPAQEYGRRHSEQQPFMQRN